ncbi:uncharacterized protein LOC124844685 [Vigna umbellata]|uniref:uncharacterized protein LOC124844685 n=1 Tax=Vigna umbellata TaxID=87088 RepID=UPI001F5FF11E|nr:uncharacterized protein LOC124844685 [Vigna umbellata]
MNFWSFSSDYAGVGMRSDKRFFRIMLERFRWRGVFTGAIAGNRGSTYLVQSHTFHHTQCLPGQSSSGSSPVSLSRGLPAPPLLRPPPPPPPRLPPYAPRRLPTLLAAKTIFITDNSPTNFSLDHTPFTHPDLFSASSLAGVQSFLDYSLFGDGLPPSPSPSAGNSIDSFWNSGASSFGSRLNGIVLLPLFSFVLPLLPCQGFSISFEREREKRGFADLLLFPTRSFLRTRVFDNNGGSRKL